MLIKQGKIKKDEKKMKKVLRNPINPLLCAYRQRDNNQPTNMKTKYKETAPATQKNISLDLRDAKGRDIGICIRTAPITVTETDENGYYTVFDAIGEYVKVTIIVTRNGQKFGAYQYPSFYKSQTEADVAIAKRIKNTKAKYAKQFAGA